MIIIDIEPEWGVKLYPKNEEDNERYKKFGFEDSDGRFYRSLFFSPRHGVCYAPECKGIHFYFS